MHTFATSAFEHLAHRQPSHAGLWHLLGEVEAVFGFWAMVLLLFVAIYVAPTNSMTYLQGKSFAEPAFIFVIMVIAASRPVLDLAGALLAWISKLVPLKPPGRLLPDGS